jgi:hypothetical protein
MAMAGGRLARIVDNLTARFLVAEDRRSDRRRRSGHESREQ